jgi:hypothetical protein
MATTPGALTPERGFMNFMLNTGRQLMPSAPESAGYHSGAGANRIYWDPDHDLVIVVRWLDAGRFDEFVGRVLAALGTGPTVGVAP